MSSEFESPSRNPYPSSRLYFPSSPKKKRFIPNSGIEEELRVTEIRGRKYLLSPSSPSKPKPRLQPPTTRTTTAIPKRSLALSVPEQHQTNVDFDVEEASLPRKSAQADRPKRKRRESETNLIDTYGSESELEHQPQRRPKIPRQKRGPKKTPGAGKNKAASHSDEVVFSSSVVQKWQPISSEVSSVFNGILIAALGQSTGDLRGASKVQAEKQIQSVIREVTLELKSARAPRHKPKLTDRAKQNVTELKEECVALVQRNSELEEGLKEKTRVIEELNSRAEQMASSEGRAVSRTGHQSDPLRDMSNFEDYISELFNS